MLSLAIGDLTWTYVENLVHLLQVPHFMELANFPTERIQRVGALVTVINLFENLHI